MRVRATVIGAALWLALALGIAPQAAGPGSLPYTTGRPVPIARSYTLTY